jgi:hypothetical protein
MTDRPSLDKYALVARWAPATLLVIPISVTLLLGLPTIATAVGKIAAVVLALGMPIVVSQLVRNAGRSAQERLYDNWGGPPTTLGLRDRLSRTDVTSERLRRRLRAVVGEYPHVPDAADAGNAGGDVYEAITNVLRNKTRASAAFPTVFDELSHYGFWRNSYGVRRYGVGIAVAAAAAAGIMAGVTASGTGDGGTSGWIIAGAIDVVAAGLWLSLGASRVRTAGDRYAEALLGAVENIAPSGD